MTRLEDLEQTRDRLNQQIADLTSTRDGIQRVIDQHHADAAAAAEDEGAKE